MNDTSAIWAPICGFVSRLRCWVRVARRCDVSLEIGHWGQLLILSTEGYLEGPGGPIPLRDVEWVEISTSLVKGDIAGRPREMIDVREEIIAGLRELPLRWEVRDGIWATARAFEEVPVQIVRIVNPLVSNSGSSL